MLLGGADVDARGVVGVYCLQVRLERHPEHLYLPARRMAAS